LQKPRRLTLDSSENRGNAPRVPDRAPRPRSHRSTFACGIEPLDRYFQQQVTQDIRRRVTACYVAVEEATHEIAGFYTLAAASIPLAEMPADLAKKLPRYPSVPTARLGRLAVNQRHQGQKLGSALLWDAIQRSARSEIAVFALVVDAKDHQAKAFYLHHGFISFKSQPKHLILPLANLLPKT
jgi:ribosomal protein S18 acetylase RimI-like enzyme